MADGDTPITASGAATSPAAPAAQELAAVQPSMPPAGAGSPAPVASPASPAPAASEAAPVEVKPEAAPEVPTPEPTLLEKFDTEQKAKEPKPGEEKKPDDEKPAAEAAAKPEGETKPVEAAPPVDLPAVEYKYELPESLTMDDARRGEFHTALDAFRGDNANPQPLLDLHNKAMTEFAAHTSREQHRVFAETRQGWTKEVMSDPQLGGSGHQTAMGAVARMRDMLVAEKDRPAFEEFLRITGAGDHPQFLRLLHNAARHFDEPGLPPPNPKPPANNGANPNRRATLYDNPRSHTARQ